MCAKSIVLSFDPLPTTLWSIIYGSRITFHVTSSWRHEKSWEIGRKTEVEVTDFIFIIFCNSFTIPPINQTATHNFVVTSWSTSISGKVPIGNFNDVVLCHFGLNNRKTILSNVIRKYLIKCHLTDKKVLNVYEIVFLVWVHSFSEFAVHLLQRIWVAQFYIQSWVTDSKLPSSFRENGDQRFNLQAATRYSVPRCVRTIKHILAVLYAKFELTTEFSLVCFTF